MAGIRYGLPFPLLDPAEERVVPSAWRIGHGRGLEPDSFREPALLLYVLAPFQNWADEPSYLSARLVVAAFGVAGVAAAWWLGSRAYGRMAGAVAAAVTAVAVPHVFYSRTGLADVPLTTGTAVALTLMVLGRLPAAGAAVGVAAGFGYGAFLLLVPLLAAAWGAWRRVAIPVGLAVAAFLATTPFLVLAPVDAAGDVWDGWRDARRPAPGSSDGAPAPVAVLDGLREGIGPTLVVAAAGLALALVHRTRSDRVLASFALVYCAALLPLAGHLEGNVLPLVPALGALAGRFRALAPVTLLLLVVPLVWTVRDTRPLLRTDTRVAAHEWMAANLTPGVLVAADPHTVVPANVRVLRLPPPGPGRPSGRRRDLPRLRALGVGYVLVTGAVADAVLADRSRYPRDARFYERLARGNRRFYRRGVGKLAGPWVALYEL